MAGLCPTTDQGPLWFFLLQEYVPPAAGRPASWQDTATRYVQLKPRRDSGEPDPVAAWAVRHIHARKGGPFRLKIHEYLGRQFRQTFVVHIDGTRTVIQDAAATAAASQSTLEFEE